MFKSLYIHNFKCIKDLTVDFSYDGGKAPNGYKESLNHIFFQAGSNKMIELFLFLLYMDQMLLVNLQL